MQQIMIHQNKAMQDAVHPRFWTFTQNRFFNGFAQIKQKILHLPELFNLRMRSEQTQL